MVKSESGFSTIEVIVATLMLSVGILGAARTSADMTRVLSQSDQMATAAVHSQARMERLRARGCDAIVSGTETKPGGYTLAWTVAQPIGASSKTIRLAVSYSTARGSRADTIQTSVSCL